MKKNNLIFYMVVLLLLSPSMMFARDPFSEMKKNRAEHVTPSKLVWIQLHYANAIETVQWLQKQKNIFSKVVKFGAYGDGKKIWVQADTIAQKKFLEVIRSIDKPKQQILVMARFVRVNNAREKNLGFKWRVNPKKHGRDLFHQFPDVQVEPGNLHIKIARVNKDDALDLQLNALESSGMGKIIAAPKLLLTEGREASIESGQKIPYQEKVSHDSTATRFEKAVLGLSVTAHSLPNKKIALDLTIHQDKPLVMSSHETPSISTQVVKTHVIVPSGEIIVLGGVYEDVNEESVEKIPLLGDIPVLGAIFRNKSTHVEHTELLIYIQPKLL